MKIRGYLSDNRPYARLEFKAICKCGWGAEIGASIEIVRDPKPGTGMQWVICPSCRGADTLRCACDEPGCWLESTCGTPVVGGYRRTCGKHMPVLQQ